MQSSDRDAGIFCHSATPMIGESLGSRVRVRDSRKSRDSRLGQTMCTVRRWRWRLLAELVLVTMLVLVVVLLSALSTPTQTVGTHSYCKKVNAVGIGRERRREAGNHMSH